MDKGLAARELKDALVKVGMPQTVAAQRLKVSTPYLNRVIAGVRVPSDDLHERIVKLTQTLRASGLMAAG